MSCHEFTPSPPGPATPEGTAGGPSVAHEGNAASLLQQALEADEDESPSRAAAGAGEYDNRLLPEEYAALLRAGTYSVESFLGQGGMGSVYKGTQVHLHRAVAIKMMLVDASSDDRLRDRFRREAEILGLLAHPNIVPIYDIQWEDGLLYYSMKLVNGRTLQFILNELRHGRPQVLKEFSLDRLLLIFRKICDAIAFAHSKGVLHRDLKPENVMVGEFGEVLVMDWGIAKRMHDGPERSGDSRRQQGTRNDETGREPEQPSGETGPLSSGSFHSSSFEATLQGTVTGTPQYMSPEQAGGMAELDERSDIFSLGGILYAILTLRPPVEGDTVQEVLRKVSGAEITPPSAMPAARATGQRNDMHGKVPRTAGGRVPAALSQVAMKALRLDKTRRYATVAALSADVEAFQSGFATSAQQAGTLKQLQLLVLRHKVVSWALVTLLLLSVGLVFKLIASERKAERHASDAIASAAVAVRETEAARRALARSQISLSEAAFRENDSDAMMAALHRVPADLRDGDWRYFHGRADTSQATFVSKVQWFIGAAAHPTAPGIFALASMDGTIVLVNAKTGERLSAFPVSSAQRRTVYFRGLEFSPDGERILVGGLADGGVAIYEARSGTVLKEWDGVNVSVVHFSPDGNSTLDVDGAGKLSLREAATGRARWQYEPCFNAIFTPSGDVIVSSGSSLGVLDGATGAPIRDIPNSRGVHSMAITPDGASLFIATGEGYVKGIRIADGAVIFEQRLAETASWFRVALGAGGRTVIAAAIQSNEVRIVRVWDAATGTLLRTLLGSATKVEGMAVHPLSDDVLVSGPETKAWSLATRLPKWKMSGGGESTAFWGSDDQLIRNGQRMTLDGTGNWKPMSGSLPPECRDASIAAAAGDIAVAGNRPAVQSFAAVLQQSEAGYTSLRTLKVSGTLSGLRLSPGGRRLAAFSLYSELIVEDTSTGQRLAAPDVTGITSIWDIGWIGQEQLGGLVTKGGRGEASAEEWIVVWDAETGRRLNGVRGHCVVNKLAVAPDGRTFAEGGEDKRIRIRDAKTLAVLHDFRAHDGIITALAWHPTKPILASASADLTIRLCNPENGNLIEEIHVSVEPRILSFSSSGRRLFSSDSKNDAAIWEMD